MSLRFSSQPINKSTPYQGRTVDSVHFVSICFVKLTSKKIILFTSKYISLSLTILTFPHLIKGVNRVFFPQFPVIPTPPHTGCECNLNMADYT